MNVGAATVASLSKLTTTAARAAATDNEGSAAMQQLAELVASGDMLTWGLRRCEGSHSGHHCRYIAE